MIIKLLSNDGTYEAKIETETLSFLRNTPDGVIAYFKAGWRIVYSYIDFDVNSFWQGLIHDGWRHKYGSDGG